MLNLIVASAEVILNIILCFFMPWFLCLFLILGLHSDYFFVLQFVLSLLWTWCDICFLSKFNLTMNYTGVAGGTASGKTTVCDMIIEQLHDQRVVLVNQVCFTCQFHCPFQYLKREFSTNLLCEKGSMKVSGHIAGLDVNAFSWSFKINSLSSRKLEA